MTHPLPAPPRFHHDGWTPDVQAVFLETLMTTGSVREAAWVVGKTPAAAYKLRAHANGGAFKAEWLAAVAICVERVRETAIDRAFNGRVMPVIKDGVEVGERLVFNDRLLIQLMRLYDAPAYHAERAAAAQVLNDPPALPMSRAETEARFIAALEQVDRVHATRYAEEATLGLGGGAAPTAARGGSDRAQPSPVADDARDSVANESPKADDTNASLFQGGAGGSSPGVYRAAPGDEPTPGPSREGGRGAARPAAGHAGVSVSNESPNSGEAHGPEGWSGAPGVSFKAGLRTSWRPSGSCATASPDPLIPSEVEGRTISGQVPRLRSG